MNAISINNINYTPPLQGVNFQYEELVREAATQYLSNQQWLFVLCSALVLGRIVTTYLYKKRKKNVLVKESYEFFDMSTDIIILSVCLYNLVILWGVGF